MRFTHLSLKESVFVSIKFFIQDQDVNQCWVSESFWLQQRFIPGSSRNHLVMVKTCSSVPLQVNVRVRESFGFKNQLESFGHDWDLFLFSLSESMFDWMNHLLMPNICSSVIQWIIAWAWGSFSSRQRFGSVLSQWVISYLASWLVKFLYKLMTWYDITFFFV